MFIGQFIIIIHLQPSSIFIVFWINRISRSKSQKKTKKFIQRLNLMKLGEIVEQSKLSWTTYFELESAHRRSSLSRSLWLNYISISINLTTKIFSLAYASSDLVVSIRKAEDTTNEEKDWKSKKLAIEELILQIIIFNKKLTEISTFHSSTTPVPEWCRYNGKGWVGCLLYGKLEAKLGSQTIIYIYKE